MIADKNARVRLLVLILISVFLVGGVFAIYAYPGATGTNSILVSQVCSTETASAVPEGFAGLCSATTNIDTNNAVTQTATVNNNNLYMGVRTQSYNSSVINCGGITNVKVCYEWWSSSASIGSCSVKVDHDGGGSYSTASSTCPGTTANPGEICTDVTALESWTCDNFFTASGTRALAYLQVMSATGGSKTLTVDSLFFNVTYTPDSVAPTVSILYPAITTYTTNVTTLNFTAIDTNLDKCWYSLNNGVNNTTVSCSSGVQVNVTGLGANLGNNTWKVWANDSYSNVANDSHTFVVNLPPTISNITISPDPSGVSATLNISAAGVNDSNSDSLQFYCSDTSNVPSDSNICSSGNLNNLASPYTPYCVYTPNKIAGNYTVFCRMYDGISYSSTVNKTYSIYDQTLQTTIISVAGDSVAGYFDNVNDGKADILINGSTGMSCKWFTTDLAYTASGTACSINGTVANCSVSTTSEGSYERYISCQDSYGNSQTPINNLDVLFYLDYTAPTTSSDADTVSILVPTYEATIYEADNVDTDPTTYYCTSTSQGCNPTTLINDMGIITFSSSNRGPMYLRYYSVDDAGNNQTIVNETIKINRLPTFTSATDNAATILGGTTVTVSTVDSDADSQNIKLFVCNSSGATAAGCLYGQYCSALGTANLSCGFASESDSATHTWYAYIYDASNESASSNNPLTGTYITDSSGPTITVSLPENASNTTQSTVTASIVLGERASWVGYSLDGGANVTMSNISALQYTAVISGLSVGNHNLTFYANDSFGNFGISSIVYFSRVNAADTTAPTLVINSPSNASYTSAGGTYVNVSSDEALVWAGYKLNGGSLTNLTNTSSTVWYVNLTSLSQETANTVVVYGNDSSGNQGNRTVTFYADSLAPRYSSVSAPSANQSQNVNCSIFWNDSYSLSSVIISEDSLGSYENHTIAFSGNSGTASYLISGTKLASAGTYHCQFYATDAAGNLNTTSATFTISDVVAPTITVTSPGNFVYNQQTITISLVTNENASAAWYSLNGSVNVSMTNSTKTDWSATLSSLSNGGYNIRFYANDSSGNIGRSSLINFTVNSIADTIPPVITLVNPINLSYKGTSFSLNISSNEDLLSADYKLNNGNLTSMTNTSTTFWSATLFGLTQESTNNLLIYANDTSNNQAIQNITFYVDSLAPRYSSVSAPSTNQSQTVNCSIFWNDSYSLSSVIISEDSLGSYENHTIAFSGNSGTASYLISGTKLASAGTYHCQFYATDAAGNLNTTSATFTISDVVAPTITVTSPSNGGTYNQLAMSFTIVTSENASLAWYSLNGAANVSMSNTTRTSWNYTTTLANGPYTIVFWANDSFGNIGSSGTKTFTINDVAPDSIPPVVTIASIANESYKGLSGVILNVITNENAAWVKYSLNGSANVSMTNSSMMQWNATLGDLAQESTNSLIVYANDSFGNIGSFTISFYADSLAPRFSSISATSVNESQNANCSAYVNDSFGFSSVRIAENSSGSFVNHTIDLTSAGFANYTILNVAKGGYQCIFYATDAAGNINSTSKSFTVSDVTAPTISILSPANTTYGSSSVSASLIANENLSLAWYSLDSAANASLSGSATSWSTTLINQAIGLHNITFYANDSSGNNVSSSLIYFTIAATDTIPPVLTSTLVNASYKTSTSVLFNVSSNEALLWAGYTLNAGSLTNLTNLSANLWSGTLSGLASGSTNTLVLYGNDSSSNQGNSTIIFYFDNISPQFSSISATSVNESQNANCSAYVNDSFGFSSVRIAENSSGSFVNHTIDLTSAGFANYTILNVAKGGYQCIFYATDAAGNINSTSKSFTVSDVTAPTISILSPANNSDYSQSSVQLIISLSENVVSANYSLDGAANVSLSGSGNSWSKTITAADGSHSVIFYAVDSSGNIGVSSVVYFTVDTETGAPGITVLSPLNGVYYSSALQILNISSDSPLRGAGYSVNGGVINTLGNISLTNWNASYTFSAGANTVVFYANHTSLNNNQGTASTTFYVDLNNPLVNSFVCNSPVNNSVDVSCSIVVSDSIGLDYLIISDNSSGTFVNSSAYDIRGTSAFVDYSIDSEDTSIGGFQVIAYVFDLSGRVNGTQSYNVQVLDDQAPVISGVSYSPNDFDSLDPGVNVLINSSVTEDYSISSVKVYYKNSSDLSWDSEEMTNTTGSAYNATITFGAGNWTFYINATDAQGNVALSQNYNLSVYDDISQNVTTNITSIKSYVYAQRSFANELGYIILNTTSDSSLNYNVTIYAAGSLFSRINLNNTLIQTENYSVASGDVLYIPIYANLTDLTSGLYLYNISVVSEAGTVIFERNIFIQQVEAPYFVIVFDESSSSVARGQTDVNYAISVTNLGTQDAQGAYLVLELPSGFSLSSGSLIRYLGNLPVGISGTNSISIDAGSSITEKNLTILGSVNSSNADSANVSKVVLITDPLVITNTITSSGAGGGGGGSGGVSQIYYKTIQMVRGEEDSFVVEVTNKYLNKTLENLFLNITGFSSNHISISPLKIEKLSSGESANFTVKIDVPSYKSYEEHLIKAVISGQIFDGSLRQTYTETQNIKLVIQEVSYEVARAKLSEAEEAVEQMKQQGLSLDSAENMFVLAQKLLSENKNKDSYDYSVKIIELKNLAVRLKGDIDSFGKEINYFGKENNSIITGNSVFVSSATREVFELAMSAFDRGDYSLAEERLNSAKEMLKFERKGNFAFFVYLYWRYLIIALVLIIILGLIAFRTYRRNRVIEGISDGDLKESKIRRMMVALQQHYFKGKLSSNSYHSSMNQYNKELTDIRKERINLRNKRIGILGGEQLNKALESEKNQTEREIERAQTDFYKNKNISESQYKTEFEILNERLAEIEGEKLSADLVNEKKNILPVKKKFFSSLFENRERKREKLIKDKVDKLLKERGLK